MDEEGIKIRDLEESNAKIIHTSPEHHFPLGITMSKQREKNCLHGQMKNQTVIL